MNNYCRNCGKQIPKNSEKCPNCQVEILDERVDPAKKKKNLRNLKIRKEHML